MSNAKEINGAIENREKIRPIGWDDLLMEKTIEALITKQEELVKKGIIGFDSEEDLRKQVEALFNLFKTDCKEVDVAKNSGKPYKHLLKALEQSTHFQKIINLMVFGGTLTAILAEDWDIQRMEEIEETLGLNSMNQFKKIIAEQLLPEGFDFASDDAQGCCVHLDKGGGNGSFMNNQRYATQEKIQDVPLSKIWKGISTGFNLHQVPTDILDRFLKKEAKEDPKFQKFLIALKQFVKKFLQKTWFKTEKNQSSIRKHLPIVDYFDNNILFVALWNLEVEDKLKLAKDFAAESEIPVDQDTFDLIQAFLGVPKEKREIELTRRAYSTLSQRKAALSKEKRKFTEVKKTFEKNEIIAIKEVVSEIQDQKKGELKKLANVIRQDTPKCNQTLKKLSEISIQAFKKQGRLVDIRSISSEIEKGNLIDIAQIRSSLKKDGALATQEIDPETAAQKIENGEFVDLHAIVQRTQSAEEKETDFISLGSIFKKIESINKLKRPKNQSEALAYLENLILFYQEEISCIEELSSSPYSGSNEAEKEEKAEIAQTYRNFLEREKIEPLLSLKKEIESSANFNSANFRHELNQIEELLTQANSLEEVKIFLDQKLDALEQNHSYIDTFLSLKDVAYEKHFNKKDSRKTAARKNGLLNKILKLEKIQQDLKKRKYGEDIEDILNDLNAELGFDVEPENIFNEIQEAITRIQKEVDFIEANFEHVVLSKKIGFLKKSIQQLENGEKPKKVLENIKNNKILEIQIQPKQNLLKVLKNELQKSIKTAQGLKQKIKDLSLGSEEDEQTIRKNRNNFLRKYFDPEFVETMLAFEKKGQNGEVFFSVEEGHLDLNKHCVTYPQNFVPSEFINLPKIFAPQSFALITSVRSDSHESTEDFIKDIRGNLKLLRPGGILMIDGFKESYSRIYRLKEIQELLSSEKLKGKYKVKVTLDNETNTPKSVIIQKINPNARLNIDDLDKQASRLRACFKQNVHFQNIDKTLQRIDLNLLNIARKRVKNSSEQGVDLIKTITHEKIEKVVRNILLEHTHAKWDKIDNFFLNQKTLNSIFGGKTEIQDLQDAEWQELVANVEGAIDQIIEETRENVTKITDIKLERYSPKRNHLFPRKRYPKDPEDHPTNRHYASEPSTLLADKYFKSEKFQTELSKTIEQIIFNLEKTGLEKPIIIPTFDGCATNQMVSKLLRKMGFRKFVKFEEFRTNMREVTLHNKIAEMEGILVGGGSQHNVYTEDGAFFQDKVGRPLLEKLKDPHTPLFAFPICFLYQLFAALLNKESGKKDRVIAGALEFGPGIAEITNRTHPLFKNCFPENKNPDKKLRLTVAQTRSGHVLDMPEEGVTPLAKHPDTQRIIAYEAANGGIIGIQWHPEIVNLGDFEKVLKEISEETLGQIFGVNRAMVLQNTKNAHLHLEENSNKMILANALKIMSERLCNSLKIPTEN